MEKILLQQEIKIPSIGTREINIPFYFKTKGIFKNAYRVTLDKVGKPQYTLIETGSNGWVHCTFNMVIDRLPVDIEEITKDEFQSMVDILINSTENLLLELEKEN